MASETHEFVLAYDANCGPCSKFKAIIGFLDSGRRTRFVPLETADESGLLEAIEPASRYASFHLLRPRSVAASESGPWSGAQAILPLVRILFPWGDLLSRVVEIIPGGERALSFGYVTLSRLHRGCSTKPASEASLKGGASIHALSRR